MFTANANFKSDTVFKQSENIIYRKNKDGSMVLTKLNNENKFYKIDGVAAEIWEKLDGSMTVGQILTNIIATYEVKPEILFQDTENYLLKLQEMDAIVIQGA